MLKGKRVAVTGGNGFVGGHLMEEIAKYGIKNLYSIDILNNDDLTDFDEMKLFFEYNKVDIVFHLATLPLPLSLVEPFKVVNQIPQMTSVLCELLRLRKFKTLIQMSSSEVYGSALYTPMDEKHPLTPMTPYAAAKASADLILLSYYKTFGIDAAIVRGFNIYGERQPLKLGAIIPKTIYSLIKGESPIIYGQGHQTRDFTYVKDMVQGIIQVYNHKKTRGKVTNIASGEETRIKDLVATISHLMESTVKTKYTKQRVADVQRHYGGVLLAQETIHYKPKVSLTEGLKKTIKYYVDNISNIEGIYTK